MVLRSLRPSRIFPEQAWEDIVCAEAKPVKQHGLPTGESPQMAGPFRHWHPQGSAVLGVTLQCHPELRLRAHSADTLTPPCATGLWVQNIHVPASLCLGVTPPGATHSFCGGPAAQTQGCLDLPPTTPPRAKTAASSVQSSGSEGLTHDLGPNKSFLRLLSLLLTLSSFAW